jgi:hypothetical protein
MDVKTVVISGFELSVNDERGWRRLDELMRNLISVCNQIILQIDKAENEDLRKSNGRCNGHVKHGRGDILLD